MRNPELPAKPGYGQQSDRHRDSEIKARAAVRRLRAAHGPLMFIQSAGCCGGSAPMCFPLGEFLVGDGDVLLGEIQGCPFYIDARLDAAWRTRQFTLDIEPGIPEGFSLPAGDGQHFVTTSCT